VGKENEILEEQNFVKRSLCFRTSMNQVHTHRENAPPKGRGSLLIKHMDWISYETNQLLVHLAKLTKHPFQNFLLVVNTPSIDNKQEKNKAIFIEINLKPRLKRGLCVCVCMYLCVYICIYLYMCMNNNLFLAKK
jgi:hypothetical protein